MVRTRELGHEQLAAAATRFREARGDGPVRGGGIRGFEQLDQTRGVVEPVVPPAITPSDAKPPPAASDEVVAGILRDAVRRNGAGGQADTLCSISDERIIGRGDLRDLSYLEVGIAIARGVARIRVSGGSGSGSLVGPRILMTNHHVIPDPSVADGALAQFDLQDDSDGRALPRQDFALDPAHFFFTDDELDITMIGIAERSQSGRTVSAYPWTRLSAADRELQDRDALTIIQHPLGGMKQIALRNNDVIVVKELASFIHYTTDTQQGSSGSPCFDDMWRLVAVHHAGVPATNAAGEILTRDNKVFRKGIDRTDTILWIANEGTRISAVEAALRETKLTAAHAARRDEMLGARPPNPVVLAREASARHDRRSKTSFITRGGASMGKGGVSIIVNISGDEIRGVHVERDDGEGSADNVQLGVSSAGPVQGPAPDDTEEAVVIDPEWKKRKGYDADFLGIDVPLPQLSSEQRKITLRMPEEYLRKDADPYVFPYHHYSVAFNKKRRIAWYSAANVDGELRKHSFKRGKDRWFFDPRMDDKDQPIHQIGEELYVAANTDRGHLTRYLDVQWGATLEETRNAAYDSFHFSNCALQLSDFNQSKDRWQGIERFLLEEKARREKRRMIVITGPVLKANDPLYRTKRMEAAVRVPLAFWKLCALVPRDGRKLAVTAFVLGQPDVTELPDFEELFDVTAVQITVEKLAKLTGFTFADVIVDHDHFAKQGPGTLESIGVMRDEDIVV